MDERTNARFVVTKKIEKSKVLYSWYAKRGDETENRIKDLMLALKADRV